MSARRCPSWWGRRGGSRCRRWGGDRAGSQTEPFEGGSDVPQVERVVEEAAQLGFGEVAKYFRVFAKQVEKGRTRTPGSHGVSLNNRIGVLAAEALLDEGEED